MFITREHIAEEMLVRWVEDIDDERNLPLLVKHLFYQSVGFARLCELLKLKPDATLKAIVADLRAELFDGNLTGAQYLQDLHVECL